MKHKKKIPTGNLIDIMTDSTKYNYKPKTNYYNEVVRRTPYEALSHFLYIFEREVCVLLLGGILASSSISSYVVIPFFIKQPQFLIELIHRVSI